MPKYKLKNKADYTFLVPELRAVTFSEAYFSCVHGFITIKAGYAWNGCTAAPDTLKTNEASMVHDALYQYGKRIGLKRIVADKWFNYLLKRNKFEWIGLYYLGVRLFGWLFY